MLGVEKPRVGLMNIGTEEGKGNALITETNELLRRVGDLINYAGPIEGFHVFAEHVDVVVCDGFVGNIMLKSWESLVKFFSSMLKEELQANPMRATVMATRPPSSGRCVRRCRHSRVLPPDVRRTRGCPPARGSARA